MFHQNESLQSHKDFLSQASQWLEEGRHIYTRVENGRLVHYGWLVEFREKFFIPEVQQELNLPQDSAVLLDFYTDPKPVLAVYVRALYARCYMMRQHRPV